MIVRFALLIVLMTAAHAAASPAPAGKPAAAKPPPGWQDPKLQPAPKGFRWHDHVASQGRYLVPDKWHVQESTHDGVLQLTISEEPAAPESTRIQTSFTVHVFARPADRKSDGAALGRRWVAQLESLGASVQKTPRVLGPFTGQQVMAVVPAAGSTPAFRLGGFALVNQETGATYIARFEAPESAGPKAWAIAETLVSKAVLESEF